VTRETSLQSLLQVLEARLGERLGRDVSIEEADLYALVGSERDAAIDALVAGLETPLMMVAGRVACAGDLDLGKVGDALVVG
jgi:hypothetical protein